MSGAGTAEGPFDVVPWPDTLTARVVTPGPAPRLHGYDTERDLAPHCGLAELTLLSLTGDLPTPAQARGFEIATTFLAPIVVSEAPSHAAVLARLCSGSDSAVLGTASIALAEQARCALADLAADWAWLVRPEGPVPPALRCASDQERDRVALLREALRPSGLSVPALERDLARIPAVVAVLVACGLVAPHHVACAWVLARLPVAFAEAMAERPGNLREYPWHLPPFRYEESR
jgi:hypothetical protein